MATLWQNAQSSGFADSKIKNQWLSFVSECLRADAARTISLVMSQKGPRTGPLLAAFVNSLDRTHLRLAMDAFLKREDLWQDWELPAAIFERLAEVDPRGAWQDATMPGRFIHSAVRSVASGWTKRDPREALAFAEGIVHPAHRNVFTQTVLNEWAHADTGAFLSWFAASPDRDRLMDLVQWPGVKPKSEDDLRRMVEIVPPEVWSDEPSGFQVHYDSAGWGDRVAWIQKLAPGAARDALMRHAAAALRARDPEAALALLPEIKDAEASQSITSTVAAFRAAASPLEGLAFAESVEGDRARMLARRSALDTWALSDPRAAALWALDHTDPKHGIELGSVGSLWAENDPEGASAFALEAAGRTGAQGTAGQAMLKEVLREWVEHDAYGASLWVSQMPEGAGRNNSMSALANAAASTSPEAALSWAMAITDTAVRDETIAACLDRWGWRNPGAATGWLDAASLDEAVKQPLREKLSTIVRSATGSRGWSSRSGITVVR